jgi:hypothetical protein
MFEIIDKFHIKSNWLRPRYNSHRKWYHLYTMFSDRLKVVFRENGEKTIS